MRRDDECVCEFFYERDVEYDVYDGFSKRFVDSIKLCMANIIGTFLQSGMSESKYIPLRRRCSLSFWFK